MRIPRWFRYVFATLGVLLLLIGGVVAFTFTPPGKRILLDYALSRSKSVLAGELSIGRLRGSLYSNARLEKVAFLLDGQPVIEAEAIEVDYSLRDFLARRFRISRVELFEPKIVLARTPEGWNVARLLRKRGDGRPTPFTIEHLLIRNGTLAMVNGPEEVGPVHVPTIFEDLNVELLLERSITETKFDIERLSLEGHDPGLIVKQLSGRIVSRPQGLLFDMVRLETAQSSLVLDGRVDYPRTPTRARGAM